MLKIWRSAYSRFGIHTEFPDDLQDETITAEKSYSESVLKEIAEKDFAIIYITEQLYQHLGEITDRYKDERLPAIIPIPGKDGSLGIGMDSVKKAVERAVGADILFGGEDYEG